MEKGIANIPVFLLGEFHGQRSLAGYSPQGCKESDITEQLSIQFLVGRGDFKPLD